MPLNRPISAVVTWGKNFDNQDAKRILVADGEAGSRELIRTVLENGGHAVTEARDGNRAVWIARETRLDLILLDLRMPALDGFGALEQLRGEPRFTGLPIVALTACAIEDDRAEALAAGFTSYISKPVRVAELRIKLAYLLPWPAANA